MISNAHRPDCPIAIVQCSSSSLTLFDINATKRFLLCLLFAYYTLALVRFVLPYTIMV